MEEHHFLEELLVVFAVAGSVVYLFHRMKLPAVVGLLVAGVVVGPKGLGLVRDEEQVAVVAEVGVVVLLFTVGLEFSLSRLAAMWRVMLGVGLPQVLVCLAVVAVATRWHLGSWGSAVFAGMLVAMSSTAVVLKVLIDRGELAAPPSRVGVSVLLFQDLMVLVFMLAVPMLAAGGDHSISQGLISLGIGLATILGVLVVGRWLALPVLERVVRTRNRELFLMFIFLVCVGTAVITARVGLALALGSFLAGLVISESDYGHQMLSEVLPFRDTLSSLFFISVGMLLDLGMLPANAPLVGLTVVCLVGLKFLAAALPTLLFGYPPAVAARVGLMLAQVGEFSFVLAGRGLEAGLLREFDYQIFLAAAVISMAITPGLIALGPKVSDRLRGLRSPRSPREEVGGEESAIETMHEHVIIAGFGLAGRNLSRVLRGVDIPYVVLELNPESVRRLRGQGEPVIYGDCTQPAMLEHVGIHRARMFVVVISDSDASRRAVRIARSLNTELRIVARTHYAQDIEEMRRLGASEVVPEDYVTSIELFDRVLLEYQIPRNLIMDLLDRIRQDQYEILRAARPMRLDLPAGLGRDAEIDSCLIRNGSPAIGRSLADLKLRPATGATLLAIRKPDGLLLNPPSDAALHPGDVAILFGHRSQIDQAIALLDPRTDEVGVMEKARTTSA